MALGVLISSFPYFGAPTLSKVFGYYAAPSAVQIQRIQISAQTSPVGGNITVALINQAGTSYGAGANATLASGSSYVDFALAAPITLSPGQVVRAIITGVDIGTAENLTINLIGATAEGGGSAPSGCGGNECAPPAAQLLFFKGSVQQEVQAAEAAALASAASALAASGSASSSQTSATNSQASSVSSAASATTSTTSMNQSSAFATNSSVSAAASLTYSQASQTSANSSQISATLAQGYAADAAGGHKATTMELTPASVQSIPDATPTAVVWNTPQFDDLGFWSPGSPTRLTVPSNRGVARVRLSAGIRWTANSTGERKITIRSNPVGIYAANSIWASDDRPSDDTGDATVTTPVLNVEEGMYFEVIVEQSSTGALAINTTGAADNHANFFTVEVLKIDQP